MNTPTAQAYLETADLTSFVDTWNSADVSAIRSMYTTDARYYSQAEMQNLAQQQPVDVLVADPTFDEQVATHQGMTLRILGEPMMIYDKLVAFLYRWENESEGFDGAALLRYEGDGIFLHSYIESDQLTPNPGDDSSYVQDINLDELMNAWDEGDPLAAQEVYAENAVIFSDEDLAQAAWRDFSKPPSMGQLLSQFSGWNPAILGTPKRIGDMAVFAWHWERFGYPMGYGVRLVDFADGKVDTEIRYAIRPWEANGAPFMQP
jgi:hypothetical protein